ncbi:MFS transporter [Paenibacillus sp. S150]|uniref:MFS transporter n=1 Tax=Paenibacillus sp. S150 TaxID=2749826 RepID=UPI001C581045|nr:MFS transporter [Paenibacillus sp. S150]MBW4083414.1 MFS transporter [Paenibacillus sp. S150]
MDPKQKINLEINAERTARMALFLAIITCFAGPFAASAINLAIPAVSAEFGSGAELTGWLITGFLISNVVFSVPFGRIADLTGRKRIFAVGVGIFAATSIACAFATSVWVLIVLRIIQGVGGAMFASTNIAIMIDTCAPHKKGKALGLAIASAYIGLSAGSTLGGALNNYLGWRSIFIVMTLIGLISLILIILKLPDDSKKSAGENFDVPGNLMYIAASSLVLIGLSMWAGYRWAIALIPVGLLIGVVFARHELKRQNPVLDVRLLASNKNYAFSNIATFLNYAFVAGLTYYLSIYLQLVKGLNPMISGAIMLGQPLFQAIISPYAGKLSDRVSPFKVATAGMAICAAGLLGFCFISESTPLAYVIAVLVVIGMGFGVFSSPNSNAIMSCVGPQEYAAATSLQTTMRNLGQTVSLSIVTSIMTAYIGKTAFADAPVSSLILSMRTGFIIFTVLCIIGVFFSMERKSGNPAITIQNKREAQN